MNNESVFVLLKCWFDPHGYFFQNDYVAASTNIETLKQFAKDAYPNRTVVFSPDGELFDVDSSPHVGRAAFICCRIIEEKLL